MQYQHPFVSPVTLLGGASAFAWWYAAPTFIGWNPWPWWVSFVLSLIYALGVFFHNSSVWKKACWHQIKAANAFGDDSFRPDGLPRKKQLAYGMKAIVIPPASIIALYFLAQFAAVVVKSGAV